MEKLRGLTKKQNMELPVIDPTNELYLHPSDHPNYVLSTQLLNGNNYPHWKRSVEVSLTAKNKLGFVKGTCIKPHPTSPLFSQWDRCNSMVISWLLHSVDKTVAGNIMYSNTAEEIWRELGLKFAHATAARIYEVQRNLILISQENLSVRAYFTKMKKLWDEYIALIDIPACTCGSAFASLQFIQNQQVMQFLMGLNEVYNVVRRNILRMSPMPGLNDVYHLILEEEQRRAAINRSETIFYEANQHDTSSIVFQQDTEAGFSHVVTSRPEGSSFHGHAYNDSQSVCQGNTPISVAQSSIQGDTTPKSIGSPLTPDKARSSTSVSSSRPGESSSESSPRHGFNQAGSNSEGKISNPSRPSTSRSTSSSSIGQLKFPSSTSGTRCMTFTYKELKKATKDFSKSNLLGQGGFGPVYKGMLKNGKSVAVKLLKGDSLQGETQFRAEIDVIGRVHHKNLVSLVGHCPTSKSVVYEFLENNSLAFHLHEGQPEAVELGWDTRMQVALGTARALAYLLEECQPRIIHRDIKTANILLDSKFRPKVSDFGLARCFRDTDTHVTTRVMGTMGYLAPEYGCTGHLSEKSDIYAFGVVLLELISGQKAKTLMAWVQPVLTDALRDGDGYEKLVDPKLKTYNRDQLIRILSCARACVETIAGNRPTMSEVVRVLDGIRSPSVFDACDSRRDIKEGQASAKTAKDNNDDERMSEEHGSRMLHVR